MKGYKVVTRYRGDLRSVIEFMGRDRDSSWVRYREGEWAKPRKGFGPLCVFTTLSAACGFIGVVYKCAYKPSKQNRIWDWAWGKRAGLRERLLVSLPEHTALATQVKLGKRIA